MRAKSLTPVFTESIPASPEPGNLYISMQYETAVHLCACDCGTKIVTPFGPHDWVLTLDGTVSLRPSVGNGQQPCRSHYYVRNNRIDWLPPISEWATQAASARDRAAHAQPAASPAPKAWWRRIWDHIRRTDQEAREGPPWLTSCSTAPATGLPGAAPPTTDSSSTTTATPSGGSPGATPTPSIWTASTSAPS